MLSVRDIARLVKDDEKHPDQTVPFNELCGKEGPDVEEHRWEGEWFDGDRLIDKITMEPRANHSVTVTSMWLRAARDRQGPTSREPDLVRSVRRSDGYVVWEFDRRVDRFTRVPHEEIAESDGAVLTEGD